MNIFTLEFRTKIIRLLFQDPQFKRNFLEHFIPDYFEKPYEKLIIKYLKKYGDRYIEWDTFLNKIKLQGVQGIRDYNIIADEDHIKIDKKVLDNEDVQEVVRDFIIKSELRKSLLEIGEKMQDPEHFDMEGIPEKMRNVLNIIPSDSYKIYDYFREIHNRTTNYSFLENGTELLFKLMQKYDDYYKWCIVRNETVVVAAPPTRGKTAVMINFMYQAIIQRLKIVYITFEIRNERIATRLDGLVSNIKIHSFSQNYKQVEKRVESLRKLYGYSVRFGQFITKQNTIVDIEKFIEHLIIKEGFVPDVIFIDYADLILEKPMFRRSNNVEKAESIYTDIVGLQQKLGITIITASQTNKTTMGDRVIFSMEEMNDSPLKKAAGVDKVFLFCQSQQMYNRKECILHKDKDRNSGNRGLIMQYRHDWDKQKMVFQKELSWKDVIKIEKQDKKDREKEKSKRLVKE